jgi:hypothetical protein
VVRALALSLALVAPAAGRRTYPNGASIPVIMHRYTGESYEHKGVSDLDSPVLRVTPRSASPARCGPFLRSSATRLRVVRCGRGRLVKLCPTGCRAADSNLVNGAYAERGRIGQVALATRRVVRTWPLPEGRRERRRLALTRDSVFVSLFVDRRWRVFRGQLAA